jgi:Lar family restriction alleviation protein
MTERTQPMTATLLPCPFCGGRANLYTNKVDFVEKWSVGCGDCNADMDACEDTQAEAAEAWNTRSTSPSGSPVGWGNHLPGRIEP